MPRRMIIPVVLLLTLLLSSGSSEAKYQLTPFTSNSNFNIDASDGHIWIEYQEGMFGIMEESGILDDPHWESSIIQFLRFDPRVHVDSTNPDLPPIFDLNLWYLNEVDDPNGIEEIVIEAGSQTFRFPRPELCRMIMKLDIGDFNFGTYVDLFLTPDNIGLLQAILDAPDGRVRFTIDTGLPFSGVYTFEKKQLDALRELYYAYLSCGALSNDFSAIKGKGFREIIFNTTYEEMNSYPGEAPPTFRKERKPVDTAYIRNNPDLFEIEELSNDKYRFEYVTSKKFELELGMFTTRDGSDYPIGGGEWMLVIDDNDADRTELALKFWLNCYSDTPMNIHAVSFDLAGKRYTFDVSRTRFDLDDEESVFHERVGITPSNQWFAPGTSEFMVDMIALIKPLIGSDEDHIKEIDTLRIPVILHGDREYYVEMSGWFLVNFATMYNTCMSCNGLDCLRGTIPTPVTVTGLF